MASIRSSRVALPLQMATYYEVRLRIDKLDGPFLLPVVHHEGCDETMSFPAVCLTLDEAQAIAVRMAQEYYEENSDCRPELATVAWSSYS